MDINLFYGTVCIYSISNLVEKLPVSVIVLKRAPHAVLPRTRLTAMSSTSVVNTRVDKFHAVRSANSSEMLRVYRALKLGIM